MQGMCFTILLASGGLLAVFVFLGVWKRFCASSSVSGFIFTHVLLCMCLWQGSLSVQESGHTGLRPALVPHVCVACHVISLCLTLCNTMGCSAPGSPVHGTLQASTLERADVLPSGGLPNLGVSSAAPALQADSLSLSR